MDRLGLGAGGVPPGDVFITGSAGRIGGALRERLGAAGYAIRHSDIAVPTDADIARFTQCDLNDQDRMAAAMAGCRALVHCGGHPRDIDWPTIERRNFSGTYNVFQAAKRAGVSTVIYASSNQMCALHPADTLLSPDLDPRPAGLYGVSKAFGEALLRAEAEANRWIAFSWRIACYKPAPVNARDLRLWLSPDDAARLVDRCLRWSESGYRMIWGVSGNTRTRIDDPVARLIGYAPQDDAEDHLEALKAAGVDTSLVSEWPYLGGDKALEWVTGASA
ncbi:NAD-dependent epimerase/dehydratase family protein [Sandaracinobacteroides saxicola]|uniref:NAD(P)-dependent oxidoreductase n=1 Tax=Sandaracinobacteroides saxicola TaxID=2759707 RepID=A0A7G5IM56_9SPHN|nr:NAD(P)-dependent oxidoreductase [Sandaracinobacteroides saxicola]QMW24448.1 NAD(P)-dependent oxidoreductase [Sandaracinobacteroides saxicola]